MEKKKKNKSHQAYWDEIQNNHGSKWDGSKWFLSLIVANARYDLFFAHIKVNECKHNSNIKW